MSKCQHCSTAAWIPGPRSVSFPSERLYTLILKECKEKKVRRYLLKLLPTGRGLKTLFCFKSI